MGSNASFRPLTVGLFVGTDVYSQLMAADLAPRLVRAGHHPYIFLPKHKGGKNAHLQPVELRELAFYERGLLQDHIIPALNKSDPSIPAKTAAMASSAAPFFTVHQLAAHHSIPVEPVPDVNSAEFVASLAARGISLGFSMRCYQRFKTDIITHFSNHLGLYNLHPGTLPGYRGVMTTVRAMNNLEPNFGYSMHEINLEWDAGALVDVQERPLDNKVAMVNYLNTVWTLGVQMIVDLVDKVAKGEKIPSLPQDEEKSNYWGFPTREELDEAFAKGIRLVEPQGMKDILVNAFAGPAEEKELRRVLDEATAEWHKANPREDEKKAAA